VQKAVSILKACDIQPTPQRMAVVEYVLRSKTHPTADEVLAGALRQCPTVSRATVYNTLKLLVARGLLRTQTIREGVVVYDPNVKDHHHLIDDDTGEIHDIPWEQLQVKGQENLKDFEVVELQVIVRGRKKRR
jgi:Fe2+ or Zn2+ uptake regulation protein